MRRVGSCLGSLLSYVFLALFLAPFIVPPLAVEIVGVIAPGSVVAKREVISTFTNTWARNLYVDVRYQPQDATEPEVIALAVDATTYDRLHAGDEAEVRYTPHPLLRTLSTLGFTRLQFQSLPMALVARLGNFLVTGAGILLWFVLLAIWSKWRSNWLMLILVLFMVAGSIVITMGWPTPQPPGELTAGSATIQKIRRVDKLLQGRRSAAIEAAQPYDIVELSFVPAGRTDPVVAVDMLDAESVPNLAVEATVPIRYSAQNPRWAQIDGARRTFYRKNLIFVAVIPLALLGIVLLWWLLNRFRRQRRVGGPSLP